MSKRIAVLTVLQTAAAVGIELPIINSGFPEGLAGEEAENALPDFRPGAYRAGLWRPRAHGVHFCGLYETAQDRDDIILGYLRQGILDKAQVLYTPTERTAGSFAHEYRTRYPQDPELSDNPRFVVNTAKDLYYPDGAFSPLKMTTNLDRFFEESQKRERSVYEPPRKWSGRSTCALTGRSSWHMSHG